jgi:hypothetical protein
MEDLLSSAYFHAIRPRARFNLQNTSRGGDARRRSSADHLIRLEEERRGDGEAEGLSGLEVNA